MPIRSPYPDVEIPDVSLVDFLFTDFGERAGAQAFIDGASGAALTFAELHGMVGKIAAALAERGIGSGDVVALFAPNTPYFAAVFHGILRANATVTSVNSLYT
ncbi:MAG: AMP-binding protein, partial [Pseudonocardia sp.]